MVYPELLGFFQRIYLHDQTESEFKKKPIHANLLVKLLPCIILAIEIVCTVTTGEWSLKIVLK